MKTKALLKKISKFYPKSIAKKYHDYPGLQTGKLKEEVKTILLCLDFDEIVFNKMKEDDLLNKIDLIITHHPFIYGKKKYVFLNDQNKEKLCNLIDSYNIPICSYHTNFDEGTNGMNDALAEALDLINIKPLETMQMARGGILKKSMNVYDFAKYAKEKLNVDYGLLLSYGKSEITSVAIVGGGGWYGYRNAQEEGYDIFISGDIPHHGRRGVISYKYNYLDLPHEIEKIFMKQMKKVLLDIDDQLNVITIDHEELPKVI